MQAETRAHLATVLAHGVDGIEPRTPSAPLEDTLWRDLIDVVSDERLTGLFTGVARATWPLTDDQRSEAAQLARQHAMRALALERSLLYATDVLDEAGITARVVKGLATGHVAYPTPTWRESGDVDLWIEPGRFSEAVDAIVAAGSVTDLERVGSPAELPAHAWRDPIGTEIDLHRVLRYGPATVPESAFDHRCTAITVSGHTITALSPDAMLVHAALHFAGGRSRLSSLADVVRLHGPDVDLETGLGEPIGAMAAAAVLGALGEARRWMPLPSAPYEQWLERRAPRAARGVQRALDSSPLLAGRVARLCGLRPRDAAQVLADVFLPGQASLQRRGVTRAQHYRMMVTGQIPDPDAAPDARA